MRARSPFVPRWPLRRRPAPATDAESCVRFDFRVCREAKVVTLGASPPRRGVPPVRSALTPACVLRAQVTSRWVWRTTL